AGLFGEAGDEVRDVRHVLEPAGAGYVPLDPALPAARIAEILADAAVDVIVTEPGLPATPGVTRVEVSVRNDVAATVPGVPDPTPSSPAYAIYTSGSTGRPKGVVVTHANVVALLRHALPLYDVRETDVWSLFHSYGFDFSVWELWGALATGAECFVVPLAVAQSPESTLRMLAERRVTVLNQVPSVFARFVDAFVSAGAPALSLRYVIFGGEAVNLAAADRFGELAAATGRRPPVLVNMYGITETTVHATWQILRPDRDPALRSPIGRPLPHLSIAVLDQDLRPVPEGAVGELWIAGEGVAAGYLNRPGANAERFRDLDLGSGPVRHYRSGDLARLLPGGALDYRGRADDQLKVHGFRIEPGEIETVLRAEPEADDVAVTVVVAASGAPILAALAVLARGHADDVLDRLARRARAQLPDHLVPAVCVPVAALPVTASGKLDRAALPALAGTSLPAAGRAREPVPTGPAAELAAAIAHRAGPVLGLGGVTAEDDLRALGLDSFGAARLARVLFEENDLSLPVRDFLRHGTPAAIAAAHHSGSRPPAAVVSPAGTLVPTEQQVAMWLYDFAWPERSLANVVLFAYRIRGDLDPHRLAAALRTVTGRHDALRTAVRGDENGIPAAFALSVPEAATITVPAGRGAELTDDDLRNRARDLAKAVALETGPLIAAEVRPGAVVLAVHHAAFDGLSEHVLTREISALLSGRDLPPAPSYREFARLKPAGSDRADLVRWAARLARTSALEWPARTETRSEAGSVVRPWAVPEDLPSRLSAPARAARVTPFVLLLGAFGAAVRSVTGTSRFCVGVPVAGRDSPSHQDAIGCFVRTVVVPFDEETFATPVGGVSDAWTKALSYNDVPMSELTRAAGRRALDRPPLFQVFFAWQNHGAARWSVPGLSVEAVDAVPAVPRFELTLVLWPRNGREQARGRLEYDPGWVSDDTACRLQEAFSRALDELTAQASGNARR
ncbi:amino acid adenylation domain-containing protein, partial [Amycolatopsis sp. NPDC000740]|uniref:amino acid adenylation domain-containing protein n=1 Tax=Amycolatopsis sp. NPDC000740 TaxID=3154269 RepID=UPI00332B69B0